MWQLAGQLPCPTKQAGKRIYKDFNVAEPALYGEARKAREARGGRERRACARPACTIAASIAQGAQPLQAICTKPRLLCRRPVVPFHASSTQPGLEHLHGIGRAQGQSSSKGEPAHWMKAA